MVKTGVSRRTSANDRVRRRIAAIVTLALLPGSLVALPALAEEGSASPVAETRSSLADCASEAETIEAASEMAQECGADVVVGESLTEWQTATVDSESGDLAVDTSVMAVRQDSDGDGVWASVDVQISTEPVSTTDSGAVPAGMLPVTGGVEPIWVNPGGPAGADLPLAILGPVDDRVSMFSASLPLTAPVTVDGARATYDFGGGVSLVASVSDDGTAVTPVVRVADQAALAHLSDDLLTEGGDDAAGPLALSFPLTTSEGLVAEAADVGFEYAGSGAGGVRLRGAVSCYLDVRLC